MGRKRGPVTMYPAPCRGGCGRTLRPSRTTLEDYPGTLSLDGLGRCRTCRGAMAHNGHARPDGPSSVEANRASLERWLNGRNPSNRVKVVRL